MDEVVPSLAPVSRQPPLPREVAEKMMQRALWCWHEAAAHHAAVPHAPEQRPAAQQPRQPAGAVEPVPGVHDVVEHGGGHAQQQQPAAREERAHLGDGREVALGVERVAVAAEAVVLDAREGHDRVEALAARVVARELGLAERAQPTPRRREGVARRQDRLVPVDGGEVGMLQLG